MVTELISDFQLKGNLGSKFWRQIRVKYKKNSWQEVYTVYGK